MTAGRPKRPSFRESQAELIYRLRTEGDTPGRQAAAVGVGAFIGASPFWGLHLLLCAVTARLFGLNRLKTYLASNLANPLSAPLIFFVEIQVGHWVREGRFIPLSLRAFRSESLWSYGGDLLTGWLVVGGSVSTLVAFGVYEWLKRTRIDPRTGALIETAARGYVVSGIRHWEWVRAKLRWDPVYLSLLRAGLIPSGGRLLDLGCGKGILLSLIVAAKHQTATDEWPEGWPEAPRDVELQGFELRDTYVQVARRALGEAAQVERADLRAVTHLPACRVVVLLDVLHFVPPAVQEQILACVGVALEPEGVLVIREADTSRGVRALVTRGGERLMTLLRGAPFARFHYRTLAGWEALLQSAGFATESRPMSAGTPHCNVLIVARRAVHTAIAQAGAARAQVVGADGGV